MFQFEPYIIRHGFRDLDFFVATPLSRDWYDPPKPYALLEYEWVSKNVLVQQKAVIDAGCHHGHYSIVLAALHPFRLSLVDLHAANLDIAEVNMRLNQFVPWQILQAGIWNTEGKVQYDGFSNGAMIQEGGIEVNSIRLKDIDKQAQVVKLDIEGAEYVVLADALGTMSVDTWIVELHVGNNDSQAPDKMAQMLTEHGYRLEWVNRETNHIETYKLGTVWQTHSTLFARR